MLDFEGHKTITVKTVKEREHLMSLVESKPNHTDDKRTLKKRLNKIISNPKVKKSLEAMGGE